MIILWTNFLYKYNFVKLLKKYCIKIHENVFHYIYIYYENHLKEIFERKIRNSGFNNYIELQW